MNAHLKIKYALVVLVAVLCSVISFLMGNNPALGIVLGGGILIGTPILIVFSVYPFYGLILTFIISFFLLGILRFVDAPLGILMDAIIIYLFLVMLYGLIQKRESLPIRNPLGILFIVWIVYNIFQVANPAGESIQSWIYAIRPVAFTMLIYFVAVRYIVNYKQIRIYMFVLLILALFLALYGIVQEFNGLTGWEEAWVKKDKMRYNLFFTNWKYRKFSFFADPMTFGVTCAYTGVFALILGFGKNIVSWKRTLLFLGAGIMFFSMVFSGTRTAYVMPVAALAFYVILNFNLRVIILSSILFGAGAGVILSPIKSLGPLDANSLDRIRSAFMPAEDASFNVRLKNQAMIQPYIQTHPIGGGIGSTGMTAGKFTPWTMLSQFQVDSGFVKIGVEQGTLGLLIYCLLWFFAFKTGIDAYFNIQDEKIRTIIAAILCMFFAIIVANYAQEVVTMYPTSIVVYCSMGALTSFNWQVKNNLLKK